MKLSSKISLGYAVVIALMVGMLIYQSSIIHQMQEVNRRLSQVNFRAANLSDQLRQTLDPIEEFSRKFVVTRDPGYRRQVKERQDLFEQHLEQIDSLTLSDQYRSGIESILISWQRYRTVDSELETSSPEEAAVVLISQLAHLASLRVEIDEVMLAVQDSIASQVRMAARTGARAEWISLAAAAVALSTVILVSLVIVRSVSTRLNQLTRGTRAIAQGDFDYKLSTSSQDEFSRLSQDFNSMAERLSELDQMKKDFVSHVSHELKTPLGSIQETHNLLLEEIPGPLSSDQKRLIQLNLQSTRRLSSMIHNLLDLSRIEAGMMEYHLVLCDLTVLVQTALEELQPQLAEPALNIRSQFPEAAVTIEGDKDLLFQVVLNLLGNAMKFSPQGGEIEVETRVTSQLPGGMPSRQKEKVVFSQQGYAVLTVSDSGPGVPDPHKEGIFEKFRQLPGKGRIRGQGAGLGLTICRRITEGHGGAIWVEDRPAGGSVFAVLLPQTR